MCRLHRHDEIAEIPVAGEAVRGRDHRCSSTIGSVPDAHGRLPYTLHIKVFISTPTRRDPTTNVPFYVDRWPDDSAAGGWRHQRFDCQEVNDTVLDNAFASMADSVREYWDNKLFLDTRAPGVQGLSCRIELERVHTAAESNLHIILLYRPKSPTPTEFRAFCILGGSPVELTRGEMVLDYPAPGAPETADFRAMNITYRGRPTSDQGAVDFVQNIFAHELGHYLTLAHTCAHLPGAEANGMLAYCGGRMRVRQDFLMASGNAMHRNYAYLWWNRLQRHHYHCERVFRRHVVRG